MNKLKRLFASLFTAAGVMLAVNAAAPTNIVRAAINSHMNVDGVEYVYDPNSENKECYREDEYKSASEKTFDETFISFDKAYGKLKVSWGDIEDLPFTVDKIYIELADIASGRVLTSKTAEKDVSEITFSDIDPAERVRMRIAPVTLIDVYGYNPPASGDPMPTTTVFPKQNDGFAATGNYLIRDVGYLENCTHELIFHDKADATCTIDGHDAYYECSVYHELFSDENGSNHISAVPIIPALGHSYVDGFCERCNLPNAVFSITPKNGTIALGMTGGDTETFSLYNFSGNVSWVSEPAGIINILPNGTDCTVTGIKPGTCSLIAKANGEILSKADITVEPHGHSLSYYPRVEPTCTTDGCIENWGCNACAKYFSDEFGANEITFNETKLPALGHSYENGTCTVCGEVEPVINESNFTFSTYQNTSMEIGDSFTITYNASNTPPTAKYSFIFTNGFFYYNMVEDSAINGTEGQQATGLEVTSSTDGDITTYTFTAIHASDSVYNLLVAVSAAGDGHNTYLSFGRALSYKVVDSVPEPEITLPDTVTVKVGESENIFPKFTDTDGYSFSLDVSPKGIASLDSYPDLTRIVVRGLAAGEATITVTGTKSGADDITATCTVTVMDDNTPSHTHTLVGHAAADATCTAAGSGAYWACSDTSCGKMFSDSAGTAEITAIPTIPALGHNFTSYVSNNDATCTTDGTKTAKCDRCDETETIADVGSALGHNYVDGECTRCHETDPNHEPSHTHTFISHEAVSATCTTDGNKAYWTCSGCDKIFADGQGETVISAIPTTPALGHSFTSYVSNNDATCMADGTKTATCGRCGETETIADAGSALGHNYVNGECTRCHEPDPAAPAYTVTPAAAMIITGLENGRVFTLEGYTAIEQIDWDIDPAYAATYVGSEFGLANNQCKVVGTAVGGPITLTAKSLDGDVLGTATITVTEPADPKVSVVIDPASAALHAGDTFTITAAASKNGAPVEDAVFTWSSDNEKVIKVNSRGEATAVGIGTAKVTAEYGGIKASCTITVEARPVLTLTPASLSMKKGAEQTLKLKVTVGGKTVEDPSVEWSSSSESVATVSGGKVTAVKAGKAVITAEFEGVKATCSVTVNPTSGSTSVSRPRPSRPSYDDEDSSGTASVPKLNGASRSWNDVSKEISSGSGSYTIDLNGEKEIPADVVRAISQSKKTVLAVVDPSVTLEINGAEVNSNLPVAFARTEVTPVNIRGTNGLGFSYAGAANTGVAVTFKQGNAGRFANMYLKSGNSYSFAANAKVAADGSVKLSVPCSGVFVIMLSEFSDLRGDADNSGALNALDAALILKNTAEGKKPSNFPAADYDSNGVCNALDAAFILKQITR